MFDQIDPEVCDGRYVDCLLLVVMGSRRGLVEPMLLNTGESIP